MNSFKNPLTPLIPDPVNIEVPINALQQIIASIPWISKSFGRAWKSSRIDVATNKTIYYPEVWQGLNKDLLPVMPNDNLDSQAFWYINGAEDVNNWCKGQYTRIDADVHLIVWFNLECIDNTVDSRFTERLKKDVLDALRVGVMAGGTLTINKIWHEAADVFKWFTIEEAKRQVLEHPFGGFRFECLLNYKETCP